jgi:hypothetical protein
MTADDGKKAHGKPCQHFFITLKNANRQTGNADFFQLIRRTSDKLFPVHAAFIQKITVFPSSVHWRPRHSPRPSIRPTTPRALSWGQHERK